MRYPPCQYSKVIYECFADMRAQKTDWLWRGWLALAKLALYEGDPGLGKSYVTLDLIARLTTGREFPDGSSPAAPCNVIILSGEDGAEDTIKPRLVAMGADVKRAYFLKGIIDKSGEDSIRFPRHALPLHELLIKTGAKLVVIDPLMAFLEKRVCPYSDPSVRRVLTILKRLAEEHNCAMLLLRHLTKDDGQRAIYRGSGSIGFLAAVRCVWLAAADREDKELRLLAQIKNNLCALPAS